MMIGIMIMIIFAFHSLAQNTIKYQAAKFQMSGLMMLMLLMMMMMLMMIFMIKIKRTLQV